jgi:hypothetical protein
MPVRKFLTEFIRGNSIGAASMPGSASTVRIESASARLTDPVERQDRSSAMSLAGRKQMTPTATPEWPLTKPLFVGLVTAGYVVSVFAFLFMFNVFRLG